jgi:hypothetical protein
MNKDVIYIDVEDDITAIIGKIKASSEKIVALVPPKSVGALQSAVNLKLLDRMASNSNKRLVIITNNQALVALTAAAGIPVAKNLQSKPEVAEISALEIDEGEDVIDGSQLPVGELERTADVAKDNNKAVESAIDTIDIDDAVVPMAAAAAVKKPVSGASKRSGIKVPNFSTFRKRLFIGIAALILLTAFLIWANVFAPSATIIITAKTNSVPVSTTVSLSGTIPTDVSKGNIQTITQQYKKDLTVGFTATGSQDVGVKATGTMKVTRTSVSSSTLSVPTGTPFTTGNYTFYSTKGITLAATQVGQNGFIQDSQTVNVIAEKPGTNYNIAAGPYQSGVSGTSAQGSDMTGGTSKIATVVTDADVVKATDALNALSIDDAKKQVISQFTNGEIVISDSFTAAKANPVSAPAVGAEADAPATLTASTTFTITAIAKADVELYLKDSLNKQISGTASQRIYDDGISKVVLAGYNVSGGTTTVNIATTGQIGPNIDTDAVKQQVKGKKSGEVQALLSSINGVSNVQVNFSYIWVTSIPKDTSKVDVQFKLTNG